MASEQHLRSLKEEATCSICLEYFTEPVSVQCGHVFCLSCITKCWEGLQSDFLCPQCREPSQNETLRPIRQLANMVEIAKELHTPRAAPEEENLCREHEEKLKLFCEDDQRPICVVCSMSRDHKPHSVLPIREAAQDYRGKFQNYIENMKKDLENILRLQCKEEAKVTQLETNFKRQKEQITSVFEKVQEFLKREECRHLSNLEKKEKQILQTLSDKVTQLVEQEASVRSQIAELELKCQQQDVEVLKEVKSIFSRYEHLNVQLPVSGPIKANKKDTEVEESKSKKKGEEDEEEEEEEEEEKEEEEEDGEEKGREDLQMKIIESLEWRWASSFAGEVTLDPNTASKWLIVSEDGKSVRNGDRAQDVPYTPDRFSKYNMVLGQEKLSSGRHYWEVEVGVKTDWSLGLCDDFVSRKGELILSPKNGLWTVIFRDGEYKACTDKIILLMPRTPLRVIGFFLDYDAGRLSVYNVLDRSLLFTFSGATFPCTLRPYFSPEGKDEKNLGTLQILAVSRQN